MKFGLLTVSKGVYAKINIGDYIQALAAKQFLPSADIFLERETDLAEYCGEEIAMIMNGWYMEHTENWPPSDQIIPLFVAFHINNRYAEGLTSSKSINYYKSIGKIGCRDFYTRDLLLSHGVDAYFSGCLTLTLGYKYKSQKRSDKVYFVEPPLITDYNAVKLRKRKIVKSLCCVFAHFHYFCDFAEKFPPFSFKSLVVCAYNFYEYTRVFDSKIIGKAVHVNQYNYEIYKEYNTNEKLLHYAEQLVKAYSEASCVITSRIHCALPCIGLETPVFFVLDVNDKNFNTCRYGGIIDLFHVINWNNGVLSNSEVGSVHFNNIPKNKETWKALSVELIQKCKDFVSNCGKLNIHK